MATFQGSAGGGGRVPFVDATVRSRSATQAVVRYVVRSNPVSGYATWGTFKGTLTVNGSAYAVSGPVTNGVANTIWSLDVTYKTAAAFTLNISLTGSVPGTQGWRSTSLSGSMSVAAGTAPPGAIDNLILQSRASDNSNAVVLSWGAKAGATSYKMRYRRNGGTWGDTTTGTISGTTYSVTLGYSDSIYEYSVRAVNAGGQSGASNFVTVYTTPNQPPKPTLAAITGGFQVNVAKGSNAYTYGLEIQRSSDGTAFANTTLSSGTGVDGNVLSVNDTRANSPLSQWRARRFLGTAGAPDRVYGPWSDWSDNAMAGVYKSPSFSSVTVERALGGVANPMGTGALIKMKGTVTPPSLVEGNKWRIEYRHKLSTNTWPSPESWTIFKQNQISGTFNESFTVPNDTFELANTYDFEVRVSDIFKETPAERTIPVGSVALSVAKTGIGAGKVWERGALDVGGDAYIEGDLILADPNKIVIEGVAYEKSGSWTATTGVGAAWGALYYVNKPIPTEAKTAPSGYVIQYAVQDGGNGSWWFSGVINDGADIMLLSGAAVSRSVTITWSLVKQ